MTRSRTLDYTGRPLFSSDSSPMSLSALSFGFDESTLFVEDMDIQTVLPCLE